MKVGDYVRTKEGYIAKLLHYGYNAGISGKSHLFDSQIRDISNLIYEQDNFLWDSELKQYVKKYSYNILDLIEVGDIIKFDITDIDNYADIQGYNCWEISCEEELNGVKEMIEMESAKLLSILTREQFESMKYSVKEKE